MTVAVKDNLVLQPSDFEKQSPSGEAGRQLTVSQGTVPRQAPQGSEELRTMSPGEAAFACWSYREEWPVLDREAATVMAQGLSQRTKAGQLTAGSDRNTEHLFSEPKD